MTHDDDNAPGPKVLVSWRVPEGVHERVKAAAFALGVTASDVVRDAILGHLQRLEDRNGGPFPQAGHAAGKARRTRPKVTSDNAPLTKRGTP